MRIAVVCPYDLRAPGGGQAHVTELVRRLRAGGDDALLVGPGASSTSLPSVDAGGSVRIRANASTVPVALHPGAARRVRRAAREADLVHVHEPLMPVAGPAALRTGRATVATFHADPSPWVAALYRRLRSVGRLLLGQATLTAVSPVAAAPLPAEWGSPRIVPIAIDVGSYRSDEERVPDQAVFLGRDDPRKGLDPLLAAWPEVRRRRPGAVLVVAGASRGDAPEGVRFLGPVPEAAKRRVLSSSVLLAAPNLGAESFGTVLVEGMAAGCAVVASDIPAFRWVLSGAGRLVPPGDVALLAEGIASLLADEEERGRLAGVAAERVAAFDWAGVVGAYREVYAEAMAGGG